MLSTHLEVFLQVAESGSLSRAASLRNCSTVSIMNQMNSFEEKLGIKLLERSSHGISLTEAGETFYAEAKKLKATASDILETVREIASGKLPLINIGNSFLRPCKPLLDKMQRSKGRLEESFRIKIVAFNDEPEEFSSLLNGLGEKVDCFVSPYDCTTWLCNYNIYHLGYYSCCISMPAGHRLAQKTELTWSDMAGETLMLVAPGISPVIDRIREDVKNNHPEIILVDSPSYYDVETFNICQQKGYLLETPEIWRGVHPGIITLPVAWPYRLPYGLVFSKRPSPALERFISAIGKSGVGE